MVGDNFVFGGVHNIHYIYLGNAGKGRKREIMGRTDGGMAKRHLVLVFSWMCFFFCFFLQMCTM